MKKLIILATLVISTSAVACPDLAGTYSCPEQDAKGGSIQVETKIAQYESAGITYYSITRAGSTWESPADGKSYDATFKDHATGNDIKISSTLSCLDIAVDLYLSQIETDSSGKIVSDINSSTKIAKFPTGELIRFTSWNINGQAYTEQILCTKK